MVSWIQESISSAGGVVGALVTKSDNITYMSKILAVCV